MVRLGIAALTGLLLSSGVLSTPMFDGPKLTPANLTHTAHSKDARGILKRASAGAPHFVAYADKNNAYSSTRGGAPPASSISGYNVFILAFYITAGAWDNTYEWTTLTSAQRAAIKAEYAAAGIKLMVTVFGSTDTPTSSGVNPTTIANTIASFVKTYNFDGVDVDYEDFAAFDAGTGAAESWLITFTTQLRSQLPAGQYVITHAPVAPWFAPNIWGGGGYLKVHSSVGSLIDWYNVQFYNQGTSEYTTCNGLITTSSSTWPNTALMQIVASGVDASKLVIGKPGTGADATNGYVDPSTLASCLATAKNQGWNGGAMVWEYPDADNSWITTVRSQSWPVGSTGGGGTTTTSTTSTTTTTTTTSSTSTTTPGSGICAGVSPWSSSVAYVGGSKVTYNGHLWQAKWWTEADTPGGAAGVWTDLGSC